jgi:probable HAF family extracellular repeat protein
MAAIHQARTTHSIARWLETWPYRSLLPFRKLRAAGFESFCSSAQGSMSSLLWPDLMTPIPIMSNNPSGLNAKRSICFARLRIATALTIALAQGQACAGDWSTLDPSFFAFAVSPNGRVVVGSRNQAAAFVLPSGQINIIDGLPIPPFLLTFSRATAASFDGSVVVGTTESCTRPSFCGFSGTAFRWSASTGLTLLGDGFANDVSGDGNIVVGNSFGRTRSNAVIWSGTSPRENLGALPGHEFSDANAISLDGRVVVGSSYQVSFLAQAYRWTRETGMVSLGAIPGYTSSTATDVSADGNVIVGSVGDVFRQAFRWTPGTGMVGLGTLSGTDTSSEAFAVSANGRVIVGQSTPANSVDSIAFRWTVETGMQAFDRWLADNGVVLPSTNIALASATSTSFDGSVTVGNARVLDPATGVRTFPFWIARVDSNGAGIITDIPGFTRSLAESAFGLAHTASALPQNALGGSHRRSLSERSPDGDGNNCAWAAASTDFEGDGDTLQHAFEAGACRDFGRWRAGLGLTHVTMRQHLEDSGRLRNTGNHLVLEAATRLGDRWEAEMLASYGEFDARGTRLYANGTRTDTSVVEAYGHYDALRLRLFARDLWQLRNAALTPYAALSRTQAILKPAVETGGAFPASYSGALWKSSDATVGLQTRIEAGDATTVTPSIEFTHRLSEPNDVLRVDPGIPLGLDIGFDDFDRNWLRASIDIDHRIGTHSAVRFSLNASSQDDADLGVAAMYSTRF